MKANMHNLFIYCLIIANAFSCKNDRYVVPTDPAKVILGKWEIIEKGNWPDLNPVVADGYNEYLPDSVTRFFEYNKNQYTYQKKYWIDSLLHEGVYRDDGYFFTVTYKFQFLDNNEKLRLDIQAAAIFQTFVYRRLK